MKSREVKFKSRSLTFMEYFENLQREYIVAELRYKIYVSGKDKKYYLEREMAGKKLTIEDISLRNNLKNIFSSQERREKYMKEIYNEIGLPNFIYRDHTDREKRSISDILNYFQRGILVDVVIDDRKERGKIVFVNLDSKTVLIKIESSGVKMSVPFNKIIRNI